MTNPRWKEQAYPLQQVTIRCQGTRHSDRSDMLAQVQIALDRLRAGEDRGSDHDDDFGYRFEVSTSTDGPSFFEDPAASE